MQPEKKILIITYYWPPAGGPGVQRWLKFTKYLPEFGWQPTVFIPENPSYPLIDETLEQEIPAGINTIKTKIWEPYQLAEKLNKSNKKFKGGQFDVGKNQSWKSKLSIWVRGNFFIPDARVFWVKPSIKFLKKYLKENPFDVLVTTGPPHSLHLIGLGLKKEFPNLKWIADFRDPWTEISYYKHLKLTKNSDKKHRQLEANVFKNADITLATSYTDAENFIKKGANAVCITNGFEPPKSPKGNFKSSKFILSYVGVLEQLRNPDILWQALNELIAEDESFRNDFELQFAGKVDNQILKNLEFTNLKSHIKNLGYLSHSKAQDAMHQASLLLLTNFPNKASKGIIPGKIFEYLVSRNPIISFGPNDADVAKILSETKAGKHFNYDDKDLVKEYIKEQHQLWKSGKLKPETESIDAFSRKNLTKKLSEIL